MTFDPFKWPANAQTAGKSNVMKKIKAAHACHNQFNGIKMRYYMGETPIIPITGIKK